MLKWLKDNSVVVVFFVITNTSLQLTTTFSETGVPCFPSVAVFEHFCEVCSFCKKVKRCIDNFPFYEIPERLGYEPQSVISFQLL